MELRFVSRNVHKIQEATRALAAHGIGLLPLEMTIQEIQTQDISCLVRDKLLKAYRYVRRPLFVEHTGLFMSYLGGLPGGLTQVFWDELKAERFAEVFGSYQDTRATAKTVIAYTDGRVVHLFEGTTEGSISAQPRGECTLWDCVFVPDGESQTFAELGLEKDRVSMRKRALGELAEFLLANRRDHGRSH
jgi:XTP/dITP diphosphohydrolase